MATQLALLRLLLERDVMRCAAAWLDARGADVADLLRACLAALRVPALAESYAPSIPPLWRVRDALARITELLAERPGAGRWRNSCRGCRRTERRTSCAAAPPSPAP